MKKTLIVIVALATSVAAQVPYFHLKHPTYKNYEEYNPYKSNEIEIKEWRFKKAELIEKELKRLNYPLTARVGPYREIDSNGHRVHTYFKREFKPRFGVVEVPGPLVPSDEFVDERISDEELESAADFYDELNFELNELLDEVQHSIDYHDLDEETRLADAEWDEHWQQFDMELLDSDGCFMDDEQERI
jgi:hypothetical protein